MNITSKKILLTGATGGIGKAIAKYLTSLGTKLAISGTSEEKLLLLKRELEKEVACATVEIFPKNLSDLTAVPSLVEDAYKALEGLDGLICNAGFNEDKLAIRMNLEAWQKVIDINLTATFLLNKQCCKLMLKQKSGKIINISSIVAFTGNPGQVNYCASKAGLIGMTKSLALEFATKNININCIAPGFIQTNMTEKLTEEQKQAISANIPVKRLGTPEDICGITAFLLSDLSNYITGQTIHVNGGLLMA